ncbi:MAG: carboxypeptidase-like regulatory domain-containing protein [Bacteroidales bacterium]|nr:carboxypeptidase-like regulatory domain-containing protein [Bacteroidales bacterium]
MNLKVLIACAVLLLHAFNATSNGSKITQTIRGKIIDKDSHTHLLGVNIGVYQEKEIITGTVTDIKGNFRIENIPVGRYTLLISNIGYQQTMMNVIVNSGKELILNLELESSVKVIEGIEIKAQKKGEVINKLASVSARAFSVEESERYAGSRGDPARMASNFAGVQGVDDSRNDIIIRGNSPLGMKYILEGIEIPNPNHFGVSGTSGGPVSILNNKVLANSDFFTSAFPASFGNSIAGIMDLRMRSGNNENREYTGQLGFLGTELTAEGPFSKKHRASYLINYRYSTLKLFSFMGINIGTDAIPKYEDISLKLKFPLKNNASLSLFSIGGKSDIDIMVSEQTVDEIEFYGVSDRDQHFKTNMGVVGLTYTKSINNSTYAKITVAALTDRQSSHHEQIHRAIDSNNRFIIDPNNYYVIDSISDFHRYNFNTNRMAVAAFVNKKINVKHVVNAGIRATVYYFSLHDSLHMIQSPGNWRLRWNYDGSTALIQPYLQWKYKLTGNLVINAGVHSQFFTLNNSFSGVEPRLGVKWNFKEKQSLSAGVGFHSQLQPLYTYFYRKQFSNGSFDMHNLDMNFTKSTHYVLGYDVALSNNSFIKIETYFQNLSNIPVEVIKSSFSLINQGSGYQRFYPENKLINEGTGRNYGIEFTLEKFFSKQFFYMITASLYESKYKGSGDTEWRSTDYNGNYALNVLGAKEFKTGKRSSLTIGSKITLAGNKRYGPVDMERTTNEGEIVFLDEARNTLQFKDYFRTDLKLNYRINSPKITHEIGLDIVNVFNTDNISELGYGPNPSNPNENLIFNKPQLTLLPLFYYRVDF